MTETAPLQRRVKAAAVARLLAAGGRVGAAFDAKDPVAHADARTAACDARSALSLACGAEPDAVHPAVGTWDRPGSHHDRIGSAP